ncbi:MAG: histidine phosphatase family protein [Pseudomonadota bacterium]
MKTHAESFPQVYLVRHGETAWSLSRQYTGRADIPLTARGEQDAVELGVHLKGLEFSQVLMSPLMRARQTANLIGFGAQATIEPDLMEWDYGTYEGRRAAEVQAERPGWDLFEDGCPGGESLADLGQRAERVVEKLRAAKGDVLVVAHRDILRILIARWIGLLPIDARRFCLDTASLSIVGYQHSLEEPAIRLLNASGENIL